jgi:hypothetical protein
MNGSYKHSSSLEGQLAAVAVTVNVEVASKINSANEPEIPSASDFEEAFRIHVQVWELRTRLDERDKLEKGHALRRSELVDQLYRLQSQIPNEFRF